MRVGARFLRTGKEIRFPRFEAIALVNSILSVAASRISLAPNLKVPAFNFDRKICFRSVLVSGPWFIA